MLVKTSAIVLSSLKYGDSARIVKFYTEAKGMKTFIAKGVYSKKNRQNSLFIPLNQVELIFDEKPKQNLEYFKEAKQIQHYQNLYSDPQKTTIALFLTEILNFVLQEEEANPRLFQFLSTSISIFDAKENAFSDFHLWFLFHLTKYLGFFPNIKSGSKFFDLNEGVSREEIPSGYFLTQNDLILFEKLVELDFVHGNSNSFNQMQRKSILNSLLKYYELHILDFRHPKSLDVLNQVFE